jgi:hypothetical protein
MIHAKPTQRFRDDLNQTTPMPKLLESGFESVVLGLLGELGFAVHAGEAFDPDVSGECESYHGAMLPGRPSREIRVANAGFSQKKP